MRMKYFQCKICKIYYKEKSLADKCEEWCKNHNSCNIEILKYSVQRINQDETS